jgi:hypothetical protein
MFRKHNHRLVKWKAGVNPARSRRCERGVLARYHWETGKVARVMILEPEYLPVSVTPLNSTSDREVFDIVYACYYCGSLS